MAYAFSIPVLLVLGGLVYGALTGRVRISPCCPVADPRMREAFADDIEAAPSQPVVRDQHARHCGSATSA